MRARRRGLLALALIAAIGVAVILITWRTYDSMDSDGADVARDDKPAASPPPALASTPTTARREKTGERTPARDEGASAVEATARSDAPVNGRRVILDEDGHPVAGVGLELIQVSPLGAASRLEHRFFTLDGPEAKPSEARAVPVSSADGTIDAQTLKFMFASSPYPQIALRATDPSWVVVAGDAEAPIRLAKAVCLSVRVLRDADGAPVFRCEGWISARGFGEGFTATNGGFVVQW